jgi:hypothetical protein
MRVGKGLGGALLVGRDRCHYSRWQRIQNNVGYLLVISQGVVFGFV